MSISKAFACFWGAMPLRLSKKVFDELDDLWKEGEKKDISFYEPYYEKVVLYQKRIEQILSCADITNIEWLGTLEEEHNEPFEDSMNTENEYLMSFSCPIAFDVFLPVTSRKYSFAIRYNSHVSTQFRVIYDGVIFLAYSPIVNSVDEVDNLGSEIRELSLIHIL